MSTIRVTKIEAKADASSPTIDEKVQITNSQGRVLMNVDGKTAGITTVGINTTGNTFTVDNNGIAFANNITIANAIRLNGSTSGYTEIDAPAVAGSNTLVLPGGNGSDGQVMMTDGAGALSFQWDAGSLFYRLNTSRLGLNATGNQSIFGVGVTLVGNTVYAFSGLYTFHKTAGATSHFLRVSFDGTATVNNMLYQGVVSGGSGTGPAIVDGFTSGFTATSTAATDTSTAGLTDTNRSESVMFNGTISVNVGGTFIPNYSLSAAPGGAYTVQPGSYIKFVPIGAAGSDSSQGTWS